MIRYAETHPQAGILGPRIFDVHGNEDLRTARHFPSVWGELVDWMGITRVFPRSRIWNANFRPAYDRSHTSVVPLLSGACLLLAPSLAPDLRRFDDYFVMYGEDVDLCRRVHSAGLETVLVAEATMTHLGGESSRQVSLRAALLAADGAQRYFRRWHGPVAALAHRAAMASVAIIKWVTFSLLGLVGREEEPGRQRLLHAELLHWALRGSLPTFTLAAMIAHSYPTSTPSQSPQV